MDATYRLTSLWLDDIPLPLVEGSVRLGDGVWRVWARVRGACTSPAGEHAVWIVADGPGDLVGRGLLLKVEVDGARLMSSLTIVRDGQDLELRKPH